jgi:hypothetical protein
MIKVLLKSSIVFSIIVGIVLSSVAYPLSYASPDAITVTSTNTADKTILQITNNPSSTSNLVSFTLEIKSGSFLSFKLDNGWIGKKTSPSIIAFMPSNPMKPRDSTTFEIKTDQQSPDLVWSAFDANNNEIDTGEIGGTTTSGGGTTTSGGGTTTSGGGTTTSGGGTTTPTQNPGILGVSSFRIIPATPSPGFDIRVVGQSFAASTNLDLYIGDQKIDSFSSDNNGNFVVTTTIPQTQQTGNTVFVLKDQLGNQKTFTAAVQPSTSSRSGGQTTTLPLAVNFNPVYHRGDTQTINGTTNSGDTVTISVGDSSGNSITTFTAKANSQGMYSVSNTIPVDRPFGKYTVTVSDGKNQVSKDYSVVTIHKILVSTSQPKYNPGDTVVINGTTIANEPVAIVVVDPTGSQVFEKDVNVTSTGTISASFKLDPAAIEGTYVITASQGSDEIPYYFGVGVDPVPILQLTLDKLNYQVTDKPVLNISGLPSSTLNLVIVDPSDKEKFSDAILLGPDGLATYSFNLTSYTPGIYSAVVTRGNDKVVKEFAVGLTTGSGQISIKTVKNVYAPGDNIIILGSANPDTIIQITLSDPQGIPIKSEQTFTDKAGIFSAFDFRIPGDGASGIWKIDATSGINHVSLPLTVRTAQEMVVQLDKNPGTYARGSLAQITGSGAGASLSVTINIISANNVTVDTFRVQSTNTGDYSTDWSIPQDFSPGTYTVQVQTSTGKATTTITIQ